MLVSDRCGCSRDLVRVGENGFLFDARDGRALQVLLHRMEQLGAGERARMGRRSGEIVGRFSPFGFGESVARIVAAQSVAGERKHVAEVSL